MKKTRIIVLSLAGIIGGTGITRAAAVRNSADQAPDTWRASQRPVATGFTGEEAADSGQVEVMKKKKKKKKRSRAS